MVDHLLALKFDQGFSQTALNVYHHRPNNLSLVDQVNGREKKINFQLSISQQDSALLLKQLNTKFSGMGIEYWVTPIIEKGFI
jgi:hypothetical protein